MQWRAEFKNSSTLFQYDEQGREILFKKVIDRASDLKSLSILVDKNRAYTVSLQDSHFSIFVNGIIINFFAHDINPKELKNIRYIYFIRESSKFSTKTLEQISPTKQHFWALGFQAIYKNSNIKRILHIYPNGEFTIES